MGPMFVVVGGVVTALLCLIFGLKPWVLIIAGVLWVIAIGVAGRYGHRNFGTNANTDLMIVIAGFGITAAIVVPKYEASQPCSRARRAVIDLESAQRTWKQTHPAYAAQVSELGLELDPSVTVQMQTGESGFTVTATHPDCIDESGALVPAQGNAGF